MNPQPDKPGRPFGLSLAIITVALVFGIIPLLRIGLDIWLISHFQNFSWEVETGDDMVQPIMSGVNLNFDYASMIAQTLLGVVILILCILAWRGRQRWVRYALLWAVLIIDAVYILALIVSLTRQPDLANGITSADGLVSSLQVGYFVLLVLTTTYLVWYINREPARAFYRGAFRSDFQSSQAADLPEIDRLTGKGQA